MQKVHFLFGTLCATLLTTTAFAEAVLPPPPGLSSYMAYRSTQPPLSERASNTFYFLRGWYVTAQGNFTYTKVNGLDNTTSDPTGFVGAVLQKESFSSSRLNPGIAIGYQFRNSGLLSRAEINYAPRLNMDYDANPFIQPAPGLTSSINSTVDSHPILLKLYSDFNLGAPVIPYFQVGAGAAINHTNTNSTITINGFPFVASGDTGNSTQFAWDAGLGLRWQMNPMFFLTAGYEFDSLGSAKWPLKFLPEPAAPFDIESGTIYSNTATVSISWMPMPKFVTNT